MVLLVGEPTKETSSTQKTWVNMESGWPKRRPPCRFSTADAAETAE
jgi:hypothetical protein